MTAAAPPATPKRPMRRRLQARFFRIVNVAMRRILGLPFTTPLGGRLMLVSLTGRRTGKHYRQPVSYVRHGATLLTPGGGKWKLNLVEWRPTPIRLRGHDIVARPEVVTDVGAIEELLEVMTKANPMVARFVGLPKEADSGLVRAHLESAVRYGFRIIRWHLDEPETPST
jgi:hypothetical protein